MMPFDGPHYTYSRSSGTGGPDYEIRIGIQVCEAWLHIDKPGFELVPNRVRKTVEVAVLGEFAAGFRRLIDQAWPSDDLRSYSQVEQYLGCFPAPDVASVAVFAGRGDSLEKHVALAGLLRPVASLFAEEIRLLG
ncbi:MAG: hypothetical protein ACRC20_09700 [Segniliparus sp.]|uniref:hypothetical protein n=1 Tax=Segniliparus sp. TaxID=2804064 RepID=UPI003F2E94E2